MSRTLKLYSGEDQTPVTDLTDMIEWPEATFSQRAHLGEGSLSRFRFRDEDGRAGNSSGLPAGLSPLAINGHNVVIWQESGQTMGRMRISPKDWTRGAQVAGRAREAEISLDDYNADLHKIIVHDWVRPAETDKARVQVLVAQYLSGSPRRTTNLNGSNYVSSSNTITLPATTYTRTTTNEVLASIAAASNKQYFVTVDGELFYDGNDSTAYSCPFKISDRDTDLSSTVFAPQPSGYGSASSEDGQQLLSGIWLFYGDTQYVHVTNPTVANQFSWWEDIVYDDTVTDATQATVVANAILAQRQDEERQYAVKIGPLEVGQAIQIKAGQLIQIKWRAIPDADDAYVTRRISELQWTTPEPFSFFADMILDRPTKLHGQGQKIDTVIPKPAPTTVPDTAGVTVFSWSFGTNANDDATNTHDSGLSRQTSPGYGAVLFGSPCGANSASKFQSGAIPISASTDYTFTALFGWKYDPSARNVDIKWRDGVSELRTDRWVTGAGHATGTVYAEGITLTSPVGATEVVVSWSPFAGLYVDNWYLTTAGTVYDDDPYALVDPGSSPYYARSDDPRFDADNQHLTNRLMRRMTNNSGATLAAGDVVVPDLTLENSVTRTTTANTTASMVGVVIEGAADDAEVVVMWQGSIVSVACTDTTPTAGDYLFSSTTAGKSQTSATRAAGAVGRIVSVDGTEQTTVLWWGVPDLSGATEDAIREELHGLFIATYHRASDELPLLMTSQDGATWDDVGPLLGATTVRDPSIIHWDGKFWMVATKGAATSFKLYSSTDLSVPWSEIATVTADASGTNVWAPEWIRNMDGTPYLHPSTGFPCATVNVSTDSQVTFTIRELHPTNRAMTSWSAATTITGTSLPSKMIDGFLMADGTDYWLWYKQETGKYIEIAHSTTALTSGYTVLESGDWAGWFAGKDAGANSIEGPCVIRLDDGRWRIYFNENNGFTSIRAVYSETTDDWRTGTSTWTTQAVITTSALMGHGSVVYIPGVYDHQRDPNAHEPLLADLATAADLAAHLADTTDAHDASAVSVADAGGYFTGADAEAVLQELGADVAALGAHGHVVEETYSSDGATTTFTLDNVYVEGSVAAYNLTSGLRLGVTEVAPDQATISAAGTAGNSIVFDYAAEVL